MNNSIQTAQISNIVQELNNACTVIKDSDQQKEAARLRALSAAKDLVSKLENPAETIFQHAFSVSIVYRHPRLLRHFSLALTPARKGSGPRMHKSRHPTPHLPHFDKEKWAPN